MHTPTIFLAGLAIAGVAVLLASAAAEGQTPPATQPAATQPADVKYIIRRAPTPPALDGAWDGPDWGRANTIDIAVYHHASSSHHPRTQARLLYDDKGIYVCFRVEDRYVLSTHTKLHSEVCTDSAAELFIQPRPGRGYFCIETNCGGNFLFALIEKGKATYVSPEWMKQVRVFHTLPQVVQPEIKTPVTWRLAYFVPFALLDHYLGVTGLNDRQPWRANLFKVDETNSHPHYGSWQPIGDPLSFHKPECFAGIGFE